MNNFKIFIILAMVFTTILICIIKPQMHKRVLIGGSELALIQEENYERQLSTNPKTTQAPNSIQHQSEQVKQMTQQSPQAVQTQSPPQSYTTGKLSDQFNNQYYGPSRSQMGTPQPQSQYQQQLQPQTQRTQAPQAKQNQSSQITAEQEEIIAWNKWRSDLENQVLKDTDISAPIGTIFRFSFTVDREGNISNLKTWSDNPQYTPMAVNNVKPVILSYQGKRILNFPPKSKRIITNVEGYFITWTSTGYSTPSDFSDYERVK